MQNDLIKIKTLVAALGGLAVYWLGGLDNLLTALIALIVIDYLAGLLKAIQLKELSSTIGFRGIARKVLMLAVVALSFVTETLTGGVLPLREIVIMFFIANEGLSIIENAAQAGLPIPRVLKALLIQLREGEAGQNG